MSKQRITLGLTKQGSLKMSGLKHPDGLTISKKYPVLVTFASGGTVAMADHIAWEKHQDKDQHKQVAKCKKAAGKFARVTVSTLPSFEGEASEEAEGL